MADNTILSERSGTGDTIRTLEDADGVKWPAGVVCYATSVGSPDVLQVVTTAAGLPVAQQGSWSVTVSGSATVSGTVAATQSGSWTVAATQSGTWNIATVTTVTTVSTVAAVTAITNALPAGTNILGKVGHDTTGLLDQRKTVTTGGTAEALAGSTVAKWVAITAETDNTGIIVVGGSTVIASLSTRRGIPLSAGDTVVLPVDNLADVFLDTTVNGDGVTYAYGT